MGATVNALDMRLYRYAVQVFTKRYARLVGGNLTFYKAPDDEEDLRENRDFDLMRIPAQDVLLKHEIRQDFIPDDNDQDESIDDDEERKEDGDNDREESETENNAKKNW